MKRCSLASRYASILPGLVLLTLAGCATAPPPPAAATGAPTPPDSNVYFSPARGQGPEQQDRDKYECNNWAVKQTGFDPSLPNLPPHDRVRVVMGGPPAGAGIATGAFTGAFLGAAVSRPWDAGPGALIGALAGAAIGGIADAARVQQAKDVEAQANANIDGSRRAALEQKAANYQRAMAACLEARGYSVK